MVTCKKVSPAMALNSITQPKLINEKTTEAGSNRFFAISQKKTGTTNKLTQSLFKLKSIISDSST